MSDDEVICLDDDDDNIQGSSISNFTSTTQYGATRRDSLRRSGRSGSVIKYTGAEGSFEEPVILSDSDDQITMNLNTKPRARTKNSNLISDDELPDINSSESENDSAFSGTSKVMKQKTKKRQLKVKSTVKIKLPKFLPINSNRNVSLSPPTTSTSARRTANEDYVASLQSGRSSDSPSKRSPKKKKTLADIVTDIHETSTDEIDSDEINASQDKIKLDPLPSQIASSMYLGQRSNEEPQPCCSKSLNPQPVSKKNIVQTRKRHVLISSDDEELPDIDFHVNNNRRTTVFDSYDVNVNNGIGNIGISEYVIPTSKESQSQSSISTAGYSSVSNSQVSSTDRQAKKQQKEMEAEKRKQEKEVKRIEKDKKKVEEAREKELKKVENELRRTTKPGEAFKFMIVVLDNSIINKLDALVPQLVAAEIKYESKMFPIIENSITFQRELVHQAMNDQLQLQKVTTIQDEDQLMIVIDSDKTIPMINAQLNRDTMGNEDLGIDLISWVSSVKASCPGKKLTLFLYDMDNFFKKVKRNTQQEYRNRVLLVNDDQPQKKKRKNNNQTLPQISKTEVQSALIELQLQTGVNYRMVKDVVELGTALIQYTKAIADAPFKKQRQESQGFDWFALSDAAGSVKVEKDGSGLRLLWINQLQQFNNVGMDIATAIANKYPSPRSLIEAYQRCTSEEEGQSLVKDVSITTGDGPLARKRKVGPELSKRMYRFFTSTSGDRFLGSTSDMR